MLDYTSICTIILSCNLFNLLTINHIYYSHYLKFNYENLFIDFSCNSYLNQ